jgi:hypothetical protein
MIAPPYCWDVRSGKKRGEDTAILAYFPQKINHFISTGKLSEAGAFTPAQTRHKNPEIKVRPSEPNQIQYLYFAEI